MHMPSICLNSQEWKMNTHLLPRIIWECTSQSVSVPKHLGATLCSGFVPSFFSCYCLGFTCSQESAYQLPVHYGKQVFLKCREHSCNSCSNAPDQIPTSPLICLQSSKLSWNSFVFCFVLFSPALQLLSSYGNEKTERVETDSTQLWDTEVTNLYTLVVYRYTVWILNSTHLSCKIQ